MTKFTFTSPRATFEETLEFANAVRKAGGGTPLDALMPAVPGNTNQCLIAANLNFNSVVECENDKWFITFSDKAVAGAIENELGLKRADSYEEDYTYSFLLPLEIGQVAEDFDEAQVIMSRISGVRKYLPPEALEQFTPRDLQLVVDMEPYIEASKRECYAYGTVIDGKLVL